MNLLFDHLVHYTKTPSDAMSAFQLMGFQPFIGGKHPFWGTHNCLAFLSDMKYIEWIGIHDFETASESENVLIQQLVNDSIKEEGFSQIAFRTSEMETLAETFIEKGKEVIGPFKGSRKKEDGSVLEWSMLFIKDDHDSVRYPFFIQWGQPDEVREKELASIMIHPIGKPKLDYIGYAVQNPLKLAQEWAVLFDAEPPFVESSDCVSVPMGNVSVRFYDVSKNKQAKASLNTKGTCPFICGISGTNENKVVHLKGGHYHFH